MRKSVGFLVLFGLVIVAYLYVRPREVFGLDYALIDVSNAKLLAAVINSVSPAALAAGVGVHSATVRFDGVVAAIDHVVGWEVPAPNANCPLIGIRITANDQLTADWVSTAAGACTPTTGSYKVLILRF